MATAVQTPASAELFYSYAHTDESLCKELQKHLTALKRSGLIHDWYDRKIEPGSEWSAQIHQAMERAGIILLLVSADFLNSKFIFEVELPFALERHRSGHARVIPVLLRPVEWRDLPFAKLQVLPSEALAVTQWPNQDEAFSDIAGKLRELIYAQRLSEAIPAKPPAGVTPVTQERVLDAAIASSVVIDEPTDLVIMVRTSQSSGLRAILQIDRTYGPTSQDVQSKTFELDFPSDVSGKVLPATLELAVESPGFDPPAQRKKIRVPGTGDSDVSVFMLTPKRAGTLRLNLKALSGDVEIGSRALVTRSVPAAAAQAILSYGVTSLPLKQSVDISSLATVAVPLGLVQPGASIPPSPSAPPAMIDRQPSAPALPGHAIDPSEPQKAVAAGVPGEKKPSGRGVWIGILSSAAAIALVCTGVVWNGSNVDRSPASAPVAALPASNRENPSPQIVALAEAIKRNPNGADLYLQRAAQYQRAGKMDEALTDAERATELAPSDAKAHLLYAQLLEKVHLQDQALQEYKKVQSLKPAPEVLAIAREHTVQIQRQLSAPNR